MSFKKIVRYAVSNLCYRAAEKITPSDIMIHSTACPGVKAKRFAAAFDTPMPNGSEVCCHGFLDDAEFYQILPYTYNGWHAGGSANRTHIGIEICEPYNYTDKKYFETVKQNAISLCADLCEKYGISYKRITTHCEGYQKGIASNHSDIHHWWKVYHKYTISDFREDVRKELEERRMATVYKKGDSCIGVLAIKEMLIKLYSYGAIKTKVDENGKIGTGTVEAVKECQKLTGRKQTGTIEAADVKAISKLVDKYTPKALPTNGDVNGDGKVSMQDVTDLQQHIAGLK